MEPDSGGRNRGAHGANATPASGATSETRARRVRRIAVRGVLLVAIVLAVGEFAARVTHFVDRVNPFPRHLYVATEVPDLPYRLRPGVSLDVHGARVDVNALGMRDRAETTREPAPGTQRVVVVGDSVAFGWRQDVDRAFARRLEEELAAKRAGKPGRVEVLNGGVPGYNAVNEAAWFREFGAALAPETVLVAVNLNDFDRAPHLNGLGVLSTDDADRQSALSPGNWSELYLAYRWLALLAKGDPRLAAEAPAASATPDGAAGAAGSGAPQASPSGAWHPFDRYVSNLRKRFYRAPTEPEWGNLERAWRDLATRARERGSRLVFLLFPDGDQVGVADPDLTPQQRLLELCAANGFECLDLTPAFRAEATASGAPLHSDIMHPNDAGHALAARTVADYLTR